MKRIETILNGKTEKGLMNHKVEMFNNLIDNAILSAKDDEINYKLEMQEILKDLADRSGKDNMRSAIKRMCECIANSRNAKEDIENLKEVRNYVNEDVEVEPDEE